MGMMRDACWERLFGISYACAACMSAFCMTRTPSVTLEGKAGIGMSCSGMGQSLNLNHYRIMWCPGCLSWVTWSSWLASHHAPIAWVKSWKKYRDCLPTGDFRKSSSLSVQLEANVLARKFCYWFKFSIYVCYFFKLGMFDFPEACVNCS
jgi:hypothetical protein